MGFFDSEEAALCISKLYELEPIWWRMYFLTTLIAGTRRGEGLALEWKDVDWDKGGLNISRSLPKTKNGEAYIKATKDKKVVSFQCLNGIWKIYRNIICGGGKRK
ncbi:hypothetical protein [Bacillus altitudinis]|uniref:hypothetical protein n=1 Tax=Bacillus altitudinis TaxID=293387 RepID=UPI001FB7B8B6|nr:hypothetical protein [Bacillus altitudinis]UOG08784.1 hypothetical protein MTX65_05850 [Bacillus altitudinis]